MVVWKMPTIRISEKTAKRLKKLGEFGQTYDDVVSEALDELEQLIDHDDEEVELK